MFSICIYIHFIGFPQLQICGQKYLLAIMDRFGRLEGEILRLQNEIAGVVSRLDAVRCAGGSESDIKRLQETEKNLREQKSRCDEERLEEMRHQRKMEEAEAEEKRLKRKREEYLLEAEAEERRLKLEVEAQEKRLKLEAEAEERRLKCKREESLLEAEAEERRLKFLDAKRRLEDEGKLNNYPMILSHVHSGYNFTLYAGDTSFR